MALVTKIEIDHRGLPTHQGLSTIWFIENCSLEVNEKHPNKRINWGEESAAWSAAWRPSQSAVLFLSSGAGEGSTKPFQALKVWPAMRYLSLHSVVFVNQSPLPETVFTGYSCRCDDRIV